MTDTILDTPATTGLLTIGGATDATPMSGSFNTSLDYDWFGVILTVGHVYSFVATSVSGNLNDLAIDLRDPRRNVLNSQGVVDGGAAGSASFSYTTAVNAFYYLEVSAGGTNPGSLTGG